MRSKTYYQSKRSIAKTSRCSQKSLIAFWERKFAKKKRLEAIASVIPEVEINPFL